MRTFASKTLSKLRGGGTRAVQDELNTMAQRLFGSMALAEVTETDGVGHPRAMSVTFDLATAAALTDPQRLRHAAWRLQSILDPRGGDPVSCTWDLDRCMVTVSATTLPQCAPHTPYGWQANSLEDAVRSYRDLCIPIGMGEGGTEVLWPVREVPHCVITKQQAGAGLSTALRTVTAAAARAGMCVIIADFTVEHHDDFEAFLDWPNFHLAARDRFGAVRAVDYVATMLNRRRRAALDVPDRGAAVDDLVPDEAPVLLVVHGLDTAEWWLSDADSRVIPDHEASSTYEFVREAVQRIGRLGREFRIHSVLGYERGRVRPQDKWDAGLVVHLGPLGVDAVARSWGGDAIEENALLMERLQVPGRGVARFADDAFCEVQAYLTPDPAWNRTNSDRELLDALRPSTRLYPRMAIDLPSSATRWSEILAAPVVAVEG